MFRTSRDDPSADFVPCELVCSRRHRATLRRLSSAVTGCRWSPAPLSVFVSPFTSGKCLPWQWARYASARTQHLSVARVAPIWTFPSRYAPRPCHTSLHWMLRPLHYDVWVVVWVAPCSAATTVEMCRGPCRVGSFCVVHHRCQVRRTRARPCLLWESSLFGRDFVSDVSGIRHDRLGQLYRVLFQVLFLGR